MTDKPFLSPQEAADLLGISKHTLYKYRFKPGFPVVKRGRLFFPRDKLLSWWADPKNA